MGNIMPHEFKRYYGFKLSDEHLEFLEKHIKVTPTTIV